MLILISSYVFDCTCDSMILPGNYMLIELLCKGVLKFESKFDRYFEFFIVTFPTSRSYKRIVDFSLVRCSSDLHKWILSNTDWPSHRVLSMY